MAANDGSIRIGVDLDSKEAEKDLEKFSKGPVSKLGSALSTVGKVGTAAIAAVGTATIAAGTALVKGTSDVAAYGDSVDKMSQKLGMSAEAYQEWDAVMQHSGLSIDSLQTSMKTLATAAQTDKKALEQLGISQEKVGKMSQEELFSATITALQNVEDETERTYLAGQLLGRGATELGALLNTSAEETQAMKDRVHELGGVMSNEAVKASAKYQDSLQDMKTAFSGISRGMLTEFLPGITAVMDGLTEIFTGNGENGLAMISDGIASIAETISKEIPRFMKVGAGIITALIDAISANLPVLLEAGATALLLIADGLIQNLPQIVEAALQVILSLANGIADSLPELVPTIVDVVVQIVETLIDNVDLLVEAALAIIVALAVGLIDALPRLVERAPEIVQKLVSAFIDSAPMLLKAALELIVALAKGLVEYIPALIKSIGQIMSAIVKGFTDRIQAIIDVGASIVSGLWEGIKARASWLKDKVTDLFSGIVGNVKDLLGINSPSRVFASIGQYMMRGMAQGINSGAKYAVDAVEKALTVIEGAARLPSLQYQFAPQRIPALAQGAVIPPNREFLAVLGDQKSGTNIEAPLDTILAAFRQVMQEQGGGRGGKQTIVLQLDRRELGRAVVDTYKLESQRVGIKLGSAF